MNARFPHSTPHEAWLEDAVEKRLEQLRSRVPALSTLIATRKKTRGPKVPLSVFVKFRVLNQQLFRTNVPGLRTAISAARQVWKRLPGSWKKGMA